MKLTLLLDGDVFTYQAALAAECAIQWDEETVVNSANLAAGQADLDDRIESIKKKLEATDVIIALSDVGSGYWRRCILPSYKMNRKAVRKPLVLKPLREYLIEKYKAKLKPMLEGDDVMGILATHPTLVPGKKIIVSVDKDMKTIPGMFYRNLEGKGQMFNISPAEADYWHMYQTLVGDTSDGYKGCPGVGPVAAEKLLEPLKGDTAGMWLAILLMFQKKSTLPEALVQARVARILRYTDYNFETKQPILWNPPPIKKGTDEANTPTEKQNPAETGLQATAPVGE